MHKSLSIEKTLPRVRFPGRRGLMVLGPQAMYCSRQGLFGFEITISAADVGIWTPQYALELHTCMVDICFPQ